MNAVRLQALLSSLNLLDVFLFTSTLLKYQLFIELITDATTIESI